MEKFDKICRTCNAERINLVNLSSNAPRCDSLLLQDLLFIVCPSLSTQGSERLPQQICYFCSKQLEIAYKFQLQCKKSHEEQSKLIELPIKEEPSSLLTCVESKDVHSNATNKSSTEEEFEDSSHVLTENLEFLDEEKIVESDDTVSAVEDISLESVNLDPIPNTKSDAPKICCHCDKKFYSYKGLRFHEKLAHKNLKPILIKAEILTIECKYCFQVFEKRSELLLHCRLKHEKEFATDLTCNICQKTFSGKNRFVHHLLYHGKKRFVCTVKDCNRVFTIKYKLTDHLRRFHGITLTTREIKALKPSINAD